MQAPRFKSCGMAARGTGQEVQQGMGWLLIGGVCVSVPVSVCGGNA